MAIFDFLKPLKPLLSFQSAIGVDIGTTSIKLIELTIVADRPQFKNYGILETYGHLSRQNSAIQTSSLKMDDKEAAAMLQALVKQTRPGNAMVFASLPPFSVFTTLLELPMMPKSEMDQIMAYQARALVPAAIASVSTEWSVVGEFEDEKGQKKQQVFLSAIPNNIVEKYKSIFQTAGLSLKVIEIEGASLARVFTKGDDEFSLILDIGGRSTGIYVAQNGHLFSSGYIDYAGGSLSQAVANGLNINVKRAEELKKRRGLLGIGGEYELSTLMLPYVDVILNEIKRAKDNFERNYRGQIKKVILSGGGGELAGLEKYAAEFLQMRVEKPSPFANISYPPALQPVVNELGGELAVAIGLGLRQF
ncbi:MAG: pilus assembly protein PilM [Patescibacteria group bacterium]|nr:pilus assembly protein PilM [Patescibacteria group bacterium]MCL5262078.1 pilus assembly protein PilM [Patescibacteria group bacterium]